MTDHLARHRGRHPGYLAAVALLADAGVAPVDVPGLLVRLADLLHPAHPAVMRGYEAFGAVTEGRADRWNDPIVRRIGTNSFTPTLTPETEANLEDWPGPELHAGVAGAQIHLYADEIHGAYVSAWGPDPDAVENLWERCAALVPLDVWA